MVSFIHEFINKHLQNVDFEQHFYNSQKTLKKCTIAKELKNKVIELTLIQDMIPNSNIIDYQFLMIIYNKLGNQDTMFSVYIWYNENKAISQYSIWDNEYKEHILNDNKHLQEKTTKHINNIVKKYFN